MQTAHSETDDDQSKSHHPIAKPRQAVKACPPEALRRQIRELRIQLAVANESLKIEKNRSNSLENALTELEVKYRLLRIKYDEIFANIHAQMAQAEKMEELGKIVAPAFAHDLNNLITAISSLAQLTLEKIRFGAPFADQLQMIYEGSQKANRLIRSFLDYAKVLKFDQRGSEWTDLHEIIRKIWEVARYSTVSGKVSLVTRLDKHLPRIRGDKEKIERISLNLLLNAIQAIPEKGRVIVETRYFPSEKMVQVSVSDNGPGIPEEYRDRIFEPFFTTKEGGTGLGLSACLAIVQQHQGSITVESSSKSGTKVSVKLPVIQEGPLQESPTEPLLNLARRLGNNT